MKRIICLVAASAIFLSTHQKAEAQLNPVFLGLALKCIATGVIGTTAVILYRCEPDYYLVRYTPDGEDTYWACSQSSSRTLDKLNGRRCEGPWKHRDEPDFRAWVNNKSPENPMFPCSVLGKIPPAAYTNYALVTLQQSFNGGRASSKWRSAGSVLVEPGESNWSICLLGSTGTNGMTSAELRQVAECDTVVAGAILENFDPNRYAARGTEIELLDGIAVAEKPKPTTESQ